MPDAADNIFDGLRHALQGDAPLYLQLKKSIEQAVDSGRLGPGDALPSERDIALRAHLSRFMLRKAVQDLVRGGLLVANTPCSLLAEASDQANAFREGVEKSGAATNLRKVAETT